MHRVILTCDGVAETLGAEAAQGIEKEFKEFRAPRYSNPVCRFEQGTLTLSCDNEGWDANGLNLMDEFSDCLCAYLPAFDGSIRVISSTNLDRRSTET